MKNYCSEIIHIIYIYYYISLKSSWCWEAKKLSHFLPRDVVDHNVIGSLNLVWAVSSEPMKMESCDLGILF